MKGATMKVTNRTVFIVSGDLVLARHARKSLLHSEAGTER
jgi:hypothetical protein